MTNIEEIGARARAAGRRMALMPTERKNAALEAIATALIDEANATEVLAANAIDVAAGRDAGLSPALIDRMTLTPQRLQPSPPIPVRLHVCPTRLVSGSMQPCSKMGCGCTNVVFRSASSALSTRRAPM
jgi:glutamate-5-semialdehyde dehydrogenase (EC 1.2.1.41)